MKRRPPLTDGEVIAIYRSTAPCKIVAADFDTTAATVSHIRTGKQHRELTANLRIADRMNASLITIALTPEALA